MEVNPERGHCSVGRTSLPRGRQHHSDQIRSRPIERSMRNPRTVVFGKEYSSYYDLLYGDKNYEREVQYVENLLEFLSQIKFKRIISLACGTGGNVITI